MTATAMSPTSFTPAARMRVGDQLFMPYGISDSSIGFAFLPLKDLVAAMSLMEQAAEARNQDCRQALGQAWTSIRASHVDPSARVGEIWFEPPAGRALDVHGQISVHDRAACRCRFTPTTRSAQCTRLSARRDECWIVLDAADDAELGIGTVRDVPPIEVMAAARDGSIVDLIDLEAAEAGDFIYNPAGTIHALGPGLYSAGNPAGGRSHLPAL